MSTFMTTLSTTPSKYTFTLSRWTAYSQHACLQDWVITLVTLPHGSNNKQVVIGLERKRGTLLEGRAQEKKKKAWSVMHLAKVNISVGQTIVP